MADRPDVAVRLVPLEFCLAHFLVLGLVSFRLAAVLGILSLDFPPACQPKPCGLERVKGIEPSSSAWKAVALPLSYTRPVQNSFSLSFGSPPSPYSTPGLPIRSRVSGEGWWGK